MISIIVCTYNREKFILSTLERIANNSCPKEGYEVVLVNNNSTDNTETLCQQFHTEHPDVNFRYFLETQQGLSYARNRGIREAQGDILVFLDDDSFVEPDYIQNLQQQMDTHPDAMAYGGKISPLFESGEAPKWLSKWTYSWVSAIDMGNEVILFEGKKYPIGANMGFRRACIEQIGDFNTQLGRTKKNLMGGEEKDIFNRAHDKGFKIYYFPNIQVQHVIPPARTTKDYIVRMGHGVGMSEQLRCKNLGGNALCKRKCSELVKWCATLVLYVFYALQGRLAVSNMLVTFRKNVTKGLWGTINNE